VGIDFHASELKGTYASREADATWLRWLEARVDVSGKKAADIGCGGGIYSKAIAQLGAAEVVGVDFSSSMLESARANCADLDNVSFMQGDAANTGLPAGTFDFVLMRALLHHFEEVAGCVREARRLLKPNGVYMIQDRTAADCLLPGDARHLRGYMFESFPRLIPIETGRRHEGSVIEAALRGNGFGGITEETLWETRRAFPDQEAFRADLLARTGRSILHELTDAELAELADFIEARTSAQGITEWIEQDRWTIWTAIKMGG